ncbi:class I SAM-dependent methyltransferase [Devosia sp. J2-20]|uniref:class I SAM-dependent methyltransferase n=1 Tax=Devosia sp. J2-20 TaxID=3026161 RepID=UPI00249B0429|nr:class I SAM-dependent methyltransferase [Devosia sp. J2-20]WDR00916.1 class I SAM-dependent methyltransferase [Devosia sp. J2-20]
MAAANPLHYESPLLARLYDQDSGWSADRDFYLERAGNTPKRILDLGCGTGLLCDAYAARGHSVTGVDPAAAMLAVARNKPNGAQIEWVQATAEQFCSEKRFDLIIMTGHAFQALADEAAVQQTLAVIRTHLAPGGEVVFESRNPAIDWVARWGGETVLQFDGQSVTEAHRNIRLDGAYIHFDTHYTLADAAMVSHNTLLFLTREAIAGQLAQAGLVLNTVMGDWDGTAFDALLSPEMVFVANLPSQG